MPILKNLNSKPSLKEWRGEWTGGRWIFRSTVYQ